MSSKTQFGSTAGRPPVVCIECQRRKQKCNREWPCQNCLSRNVPHLCIYKKSHNEQSLLRSEASPSTEKRKISALADDRREDSGMTPHPKAALKAMGYMKLGDLSSLYAGNTIGSKGNAPSQESTAKVKDALNTIPPKTYTNLLVRHALETIDYVYMTVYPKHIIDELENWWSTDKRQRNLVFSCLVLHLCALAVQFLPKQLRDNIETELDDDSQSLTEQFHNAAKDISNSLNPGNGGLLNAQQHFLSAVWYKMEGKFVQAWHSIASAVREAQELDDDSSLSLLEEELRRKLWCSLYVWDRYMSLVLQRPYLIEENSITTLPSPNFDRNVKQPDLPSPVAINLLLFKAASLSYKTNKLKDKLDIKAALELVKQFEDLLNSLPAPLRLDLLSPSSDKSCSRVDFECHKLWLGIYLLIMFILKPFLFCTDNKNGRLSNPDFIRLREMACDYSLFLIDLAISIHSLFFPDRAKDFLTSFSTFDTTMTICIALEQDVKGTLPKRKKLVNAVGKAMAILAEMSSISRLADQGSDVLKQLITNISISSTEKKQIAAECSKTPGVLDPPENTVAQTKTSSGSSSELEAATHKGAPHKESSAAISDDLPSPLQTEEIEILEKTQPAVHVDNFNFDWKDDLDLGILNDVFHLDLLLQEQFSIST